MDRSVGAEESLIGSVLSMHPFIYFYTDTTKPDQITVIAISVGSVLGFVSIVLLNVVAITIVTCCIFGHQQKKLSLEYTQKVIDDPEEYTKHLETEEARKKFMHKVMKTHSKSMGLGPIRTDDGAEEDITDLFIQVLLEGLGSDSKSKTNFIEAVKHEILTTPPNVERDKDPAVQSSLDDTEVEVRRENAAYHSGRDVSKDAVIEMSPIGGRRSTGGTTKVVIETSERTAV